MKRIWTEAATKPQANGFAITLDGKTLKKPGGEILTVPFQALAGAIAGEWQQAGLNGKDIKPDELPLTRLATTAQDRVQHNRAELIGQLAAYGLHDLLCYRASTPAALAVLQHEAWQPWLDWSEQTHGVRLIVGAGITPITQPPGARATFIAALQPFDIFQLAALGVAVPAMGSLVLGLALATGALGPNTAFQLATLDETFQVRQWGADGDAEQRRKLIHDDLALCRRFMDLCAP